MLELYFNDGNFLPESREEEQSAETVLNIMLAGKTTDTEGEPELLIGCVTEETVGEVYQWVSNYD